MIAQINNLHVVTLKLTDEVIRAEDPFEGKDLMRVGVEVPERGNRAKVYLLTVGFPVLGLWDEYVKDCASLFQMMMISGADIKIPDWLEGVGKKEYREWAYVTSAAMRYRPNRELVVHIIKRYLNPEVEEVEPRDIEQWIDRNCTILTATRLLGSILCVDEWLKKNSIITLQTAFQDLQLFQPFQTSQKKPESPSEPSGPGLSSKPASLSFD